CSRQSLSARDGSRGSEPGAASGLSPGKEWTGNGGVESVDGGAVLRAPGRVEFEFWEGVDLLAQSLGWVDGLVASCWESPRQQSVRASPQAIHSDAEELSIFQNRARGRCRRHPGFIDPDLSIERD